MRSASRAAHGGEEIGSGGGEVSTVFGSLRLPPLDLLAGRRQLGSQLLDLTGGSLAVRFGRIGPLSLPSERFSCSRQMCGQLRLCGHELGGFLARSRELAAELVNPGLQICMAVSSSGWRST